MSLDALLDLLLRWFHIMAGIMWIGNSMLFNWLDRNLVKEDSDGELSAGRMWMLHSGAFYEVEKKLLAPGKWPRSTVHWFMWQNFSTWASGVLLLVVVYYLGERAWLVDPDAGHVSYSLAIFASIIGLLGGVCAYELMWRSRLKDRPQVINVLFILMLIGVSWGLTQIMTPRAAFIHVGVLIGTLMTGNVWLVIIPAQRDLVAATKSGRAQDKTLSLKAKARSIHNNYLTFPLIFIMVSNHYPSLYGHQYNWLILLCVMAGGALVRHFMNIRWTFRAWKPAIVASAVVSLGAALYLTSLPRIASSDDELARTPPVYFETAQAIISNRCVPCHSAAPSDKLFPVAPGGLRLDTPEEISAAAKRIRIRVESMTMPFRNRTGMTDDERMLIARWVAQGATRQITPVTAEPADATRNGGADKDGDAPTPTPTPTPDTATP